MKVGVTGSRGFIAGYVIDELLRHGHEVVGFDRHVPPDTVWPPSVSTIVGDVRDATAVTEFAAHVDAVIHLAAVLGTQETIGNPRPAAEVNVGGTLNVFEAVTQYDLPCVYIAVGNHHMRAEGGGAYVITKSCAEDFAQMFNKHRGARIAVVRPMNAYGPRQAASKPFGWSPVRKIMPAFICRALSGLPIEVYGDGTQVSDCVWVGDVARVLVAALDHAPLDTTVEVGPTQSCTVNDVAWMVRDACRSVGVPLVNVDHLPMRPGETPNAVVSADTSTLDAVGIDPAGFMPLEVGIRRTVRWFQANEGVTWKRPRRVA